MLGEPTTELVAHVEASLPRTVDDQYPWPGNVRELEQAIRRILVTGDYNANSTPQTTSLREQLIAGIEAQSLNAENLLAGYCKVLYERPATTKPLAAAPISTAAPSKNTSKLPSSYRIMAEQNHKAERGLAFL